MKRLSTATALGVILAASPSLAEITPSSVWEQLSGYYETMGLTVESSEVEEAGDTVTVRGLKLSQNSDDVSFVGELGDLVLTATGDGGVSMDMAEQWGGNITLLNVPLDDDMAGEDEAALAPEATDPAQAVEDAAQAAADAAEAAGDAATAAAAEPATEGTADTAAEADTIGAETAAAEEAETGTVEIAFSVNTPGETVTVREDGTANLYDLAFPTMEMAIDSIVTTKGETIENPGSATITNFTGTERIDSTDGFKLTQTGKADSMALNIAFSDEEGAADISGTIADLSYTSDTSVPTGTDLGPELSAALKAGLMIQGAMEMGATDFKADIDSTDAEGTPQSVSLASKVASLALEFGMADGRASYSGNSGATTADATVPDLPVPISYSAESSDFDVQFPLIASDEAQPFKIAYGFAGLTLSDSIWGLFDPQSKLPRDPASVDIDVDGLATLNVDFGDPDAMADPSVAPGEVNSIKINNVDITALGANVNATGELTSPDGGDLSTAPIGTITGRLTGVNGLFDKLTEAGLLPQEQAMGVRMMLAMFAKPDPENAEVMTSEIEFKENGQIFANGQQVK